MVLDGRPDLAADGVNRPTFSPDDRHLAYVMENEGKDCVVMDGVPGPLSDDVCGQIFFSPDLKRWGCILQRQNEKQVCVDGHYGAWFQSAWGLQFSPDGSRYAYLAEVDANWWMVVDGETGPKFKGQKGRSNILSVGEEELPALTQPQFSPDSAHIAYAALQGDRWGALLDNNPVGPKYERIIDGGPSFHEAGALEFLTRPSHVRRRWS